MATTAVTKDIKHQLNPTGYSQLLKDSIDVVPDGMFLNLKRPILARHSLTFRHTMDAEYRIR
jgi:hypothetical protein